MQGRFDMYWSTMDQENWIEWKIIKLVRSEWYSPYQITFDNYFHHDFMLNSQSIWHMWNGLVAFLLSLTHIMECIKSQDHIYIHGDRLASIIPVKNIARSVHLFSKFGSVASCTWTSSNVLELCSTFYVNPYSDRLCISFWFKYIQL